MDAEEIKRIVEERYGSQAAMARAMGVSPQTLNEVIQGRTVGALSRYAVASALGLAVAAIWPTEPSTRSRVLDAASGILYTPCMETTLPLPTMTATCAWCMAFLGLRPCVPEMAGKVTHSICSTCLARVEAEMGA